MSTFVLGKYFEDLQDMLLQIQKDIDEIVSVGQRRRNKSKKSNPNNRTEDQVSMIQAEIEKNKIELHWMISGWQC